MPQLVGILIIVALFSVAGRLGAHVYRAAKADGLLPLPKVPKISGKQPQVKARTTRARAQAVRSGRTVSVIFAEALTTNWLAGRTHKRQQRASQPRRPLLARMVNLRGGNATPSVPTLPATQPPASPAPVPSRPAPAPSPNGRHPATVPGPAPATPGGPPMTTPVMNGAGAAGDFFSALNRLLAQAQAGGIRDKLRAHLGLGEGFGQQAAALEQHARWLQETGLYPPAVWEPIMQAAGHVRAAAAQMAESAAAISAIAKTPAGELAGRAPARDELNKA